ncbi:hypothetical protein SLEP1_g42471 [Rubroshorea leprosula]|uniref:Uncharacterized protein n=1 Tax=Rubroshorea leprosula TaxID=152421 RepID=A0AAV5L9Y9_9ROSI|nr:hypothetical protein SLEP1_g42471 [Rubroshorea leprosula]
MTTLLITPPLPKPRSSLITHLLPEPIASRSCTHYPACVPIAQPLYAPAGCPAPLPFACYTKPALCTLAVMPPTHLL